MSTDHQRYSTENQAEAIRKYADQRGFEIVQTYADQGKSGLSFDGRDALKQLIEDVSAGQASFDAILVYDVSRWGRFQDADESAYYEYVCRRAGISVHYCAEQFENDGSPISTIVKGVKRAMAGEYSRELSTKVFAGQCRLIELGYRQGGPAGFGLRRVLVDQWGAIKATLAAGEQKSLQTDRVILAPGPEHETAVVREIYHRFAVNLQSEQEIAAALNERGTLTDLDRPWTRGTVHQILINEKYIGNNVWNRSSSKLKGKRVRNDPTMWIRSNRAFASIVELGVFEAAQAIIRERGVRFTNDEMLRGLERLLQQRGLLSGLIIDEADALPSSSSYRSRFGSLLRAYSLVGYDPRRDYRFIEINRALRRLHPEIVADVVGGFRSIGADVQQRPDDLVEINGQLTASVIIARSRRVQMRGLRWRLRLDTGLMPDITIVVRMNAGNDAPLDYYLLPQIDRLSAEIRLREQNELTLDGYRFDDLSMLFALGERSWVRAAA